MKALKQFCICLLLVPHFWGYGHPTQDKEILYYGAESKGILCGYSEVEISLIEENGQKILIIEERGEVKLTALSAPVQTKFKYSFHIDPETGQFIHHESTYEQENLKTGLSINIEENEALVTRKPDGRKNRIALPPEIILPNFQVFPHLIRDFVNNGGTQKTYKVLDLRDGETHELSYTKLRTESLGFSGKTYEAVVLDELDRTTGQKVRYWINTENGYRLKTEFPNRSIYLADKSVRNRIKAVNIDDNMVAKVSVIIPDVRSISYMKVKAKLEPRGLWVTPESLNLPGQTFKGIVDNNRIDGIFEVRHKRYTGQNAPPFPPDFSKEKSLKKYLEPEDLIESDDPVLMKKAQELTKNARDSWEALKLLSQWVAEEIIYDIPGGVSARNTYDLRMGECSAHSFLLAAFCRAVGIPARVIWGCMYTPYYGGGFVQHGWNEVYMGNAGWIPIDTTAEEIDFIDSGHIRIGIVSSLNTAYNPKKMEILDYEPHPKQARTSESMIVPKKYEPFVGDYRSNAGPYKEKTIKILHKNESLAIEIPGRGVLALKEPDENGFWFFKVTKQASVSFQRDSGGKVSGLLLWIRTRLPKKAEAGTVSEEIPNKFKPYLGIYPVPMEGFELAVIYKDGNLAVIEEGGEVVRLKGPDEKGLWVYKSSAYKISFAFGDNGNVKAMIVHQINEIPRVGPASGEKQ